MKYQFWKSDRNKQWCWHLKADNGETIAQGESYKERRDVEHVIRLLKSSADAPVEDLTPHMK